MPHRGELWLANLDPQLGTEPGKTRPVLIVQAQALLDAEHPSTIIVPLTTNLVEAAEPLRLRVPRMGRLRDTSDLLIDQLRAIDNRRLVGTAGEIGREGKGTLRATSQPISLSARGSRAPHGG